MDGGALRARLLDVLSERPPHTLFATELRARLGAPPAFERVLADLAGSRVLVVDHASPDPHLDGDLRVVALATAPAVDPLHNAETVWAAWMRDVLAAHRCC